MNPPSRGWVLLLGLGLLLGACGIKGPPRPPESPPPPPSETQPPPAPGPQDAGS